MLNINEINLNKRTKEDIQKYFSSLSTPGLGTNGTKDVIRVLDSIMTGVSCSKLPLNNLIT